MLSVYLLVLLWEPTDSHDLLQLQTIVNAHESSSLQGMCAETGACATTGCS